MAALDEQVLFHIWGMTDRAGHQAGTGPAVCITVLPFTVEARGGSPTLHTGHTPGGSRHTDLQRLSCPRQPEAPKQPAPGFLHPGSVMLATSQPSSISGPGPSRAQASLPLALPATLGYSEQWRVQAVCVVANVTVITEQQA